jgi:hypothetical protein
MKIRISMYTVYNGVTLLYSDTRVTNRPLYCVGNAAIAHVLPASFLTTHLTFCLHTFKKDSCYNNFPLFR